MNSGFDARESLSSQAATLSQLASECLEPTLKKLGLTQGQFDVLSTVRSLGSGPTQATVAKELGITPPSLSESVKQLVREGWIVQENNPVDARAKLLKLSPKGNQAFRTILKAVSDIDSQITGSLDAEESKIAIKVLKTANLVLSRIIVDSMKKV